MKIASTLKFSKTVLPIYVFRSECNRKFLNTLISNQPVPDHRTISKHPATFEKEALNRVKEANYYGIQLDHWSTFNQEHVLVIIISWISNAWKQKIQIAEFKIVPKTTAWVTEYEVKTTINKLSLDAQNCAGFQSDNCNAMIASAKQFKILTDENEEDDEQGGEQDDELLLLKLKLSGLVRIHQESL